MGPPVLAKPMTLLVRITPGGRASNQMCAKSGRRRRWRILSDVASFRKHARAGGARTCRLPPAVPDLSCVGDFDLIIVGAGPAGSNAASAALAAGLRVVQIDSARFPRVKPCAGGVTPKAARALGYCPRPLRLPIVQRHRVQSVGEASKPVHASWRRASDRLPARIRQPPRPGESCAAQLHVHGGTARVGCRVRRPLHREDRRRKRDGGAADRRGRRLQRRQSHVSHRGATRDGDRRRDQHSALRARDAVGRRAVPRLRRRRTGLRLGLSKGRPLVRGPLYPVSTDAPHSPAAGGLHPVEGIAWP